MLLPFDAGMTEEDAPSTRAFAALLRDLLAGQRPMDAPPVWGDLKGYSLRAFNAFEAYKQRGPDGVWPMIGPIALSNAALRQLLMPGPVVAPARTMVSYTPEEIMAMQPITFLDAECTVQERGITMIAGQPGTGKTLWLVRQGAQVAAQMPVLYIAAEGEASLSDRMRAQQIVTGERIPLQFRTYKQMLNLRRPEDVVMLIDHAGTLGARLIIFDTWAACTSGIDENAVHSVTPIFESLRQVIEAVGCSILFSHHTRKDGGTYRGSSSIEGSVDNMYLLVDEDGVILLKPQKTRDIGKPEPRKYRIVEVETRLNEVTGQMIKAPALLPAHEAAEIDPQGAKKVTGEKRMVLEALDAFPDGTNLTLLEDATGLSRGVVHRAIGRLKEAGYAAQAGRGEPYTITERGQKVVNNLNP